MSTEKTDWWVGLFVLLGGIAITFLALRAANLSSFSIAQTYTLSAKFDNIGGLKVRAPVKSAGVVLRALGWALVLRLRGCHGAVPICVCCATWALRHLSPRCSTKRHVWQGREAMA